MFAMNHGFGHEKDIKSTTSRKVVEKKSVVPSSEKGNEPLTAHSTDQQPFLAIAQQLLSPIRKAAVHKKVISPCSISGIYLKSNPCVISLTALLLLIEHKLYFRVAARKLVQDFGFQHRVTGLIKDSHTGPHDVQPKACLTCRLQKSDIEFQMFSQRRHFKPVTAPITSSRAQTEDAEMRKGSRVIW